MCVTYIKPMVFQFHLVRLKVSVSIVRVPSPVFQFHLVRLKVLKGLIWQTAQRISIPFSTIIRSGWHLIQKYLIRFQFHLVRLKEYIDIDKSGIL